MRRDGMERTRAGLRPAWLVGLLLAAACGGPTTTAGDDAGTVDVADAGGNPTADAGAADGGADAGSPDAGRVVLSVRTVTPPRGQLAGGTVVVLAGRGFVDGFAQVGGLEASAKTQVSFGGNAAVDVNVIDDDTLEVKSPTGARGAVDVVLTNPNGSFACEKCFTYYESIELARVTPAQGATAGGDAFTLAGKGFIPGVLVLVGPSAATDVSVAPDGASLTATTPPGVAGSADVGVVGPNSAAFLRRSFVYVAAVEADRVSPPASPLAGGVDVTVTGTGFTGDATVQFGGVDALSVAVASDTSLVARAPPASATGAVDVTVKTRRGRATLSRAFAYYDASREVQLFAVSPRQGPTTGGTCAQGAATCLELAGTGLSGDALNVKVGLGDATFTVVDDHTVRVDLPPGTAGVVDVQVRTARGGAVLARGFAYVAPLKVTGVTPTAADASGAPPVRATLTGVGLSAGCRVTIGASPALVTGAAADGTSLTLTVPPGPAGARDVRVSCGDPAGVDLRETTLAGAFTYTSPLGLLQVDPETGAIAGNTQVTLYGSGFVAGMDVLFGRNRATAVEVKSPQLAVVRTPRGEVGMVDVAVREGLLSEARLKAAYGYVDPTNINGGGSGGPMRGVLNVTVLNKTPGMSGPVDGVTVSINNDQLKGTTDDRGQVTFSDPSLLKPVTITGSKAKFASATIARLDARNVTLMMQMNEGGGPPSPPPPPPAPATFRGRVCGFKVPPGMTLKPGQNLEAHVYMSAPYVYAAPPFQAMASPSKVTTDCGVYEINTRRYGPLALYAEFGVADNSASPATFTPLLMGIKRGLEASPGKKVDDLDLVLDMHLDVSVPINVLPASAPPGQIVVNMVFSYLDLGGEGVVPLAQTQNIQNTFVFEHHPRVSGEGLMFLNLAAMMNLTTGDVNPPYSFFYRRQYGDPAAGVEIGPMLAFSRLSTPVAGGTFTGTLAWDFFDGQRADVEQISVEQPAGFSTKPIWDVVLPGSEQSVSLPSSVFAGFESGAQMSWVVTTARSPRFDYNRFGYQQLGVNAWTSFTQDFASFTTP